MTRDQFKWVFLVVLFLSSLVLAIYLAGFFFLFLNKKNPGDANLLTFYQYWYYYHSSVLYQKQLNLSAFLGLAVSYGIPVFLFFLSNKNQRSLYGDARFANTNEIQQSGLLGNNGIIVGKWKDQYLTLGGQQFVLLAAPTRSGKGVGIVIPNLLNYPDSVVVLDIKLENYTVTAGFRKKHGQKIYLFNPFSKDFKTHRYNPLGYVREGVFRIGDLQEIAAIFYPSTGSKEDFFEKQARNLFVGLGLYLCETPQLPCTIGEMLRQSSGKGQPVRDYLKQLIEARSKTDQPLSMECVDALNDFIHLSDATLASVLGTLQAQLSLWRDPILDAATSSNDFDLRDIRKQRMTIYIGINPRKVPKSERLLTLFFAQLVNLNMEELPEENPELKYPCMLLMDEFTSIGKIPVFSDANAFIAGYNLRLLTIIQSLSQLSSKYGQNDAETFITNHALQIIYAPRKQKDANEYSEMLGYETVKGTSRSKQIGSGKGGESESQSDQKRPLLLPQEIKEMGQGREIITLENSKPIFCEKINYLKDPVFKKRLYKTPVVPTLDLDTHQAKVQMRVRPITVEDVEKGIDLEKIAYDFSKIKQIKLKESEPDFVDHFVDQFFKGFITGNTNQIVSHQ